MTNSPFTHILWVLCLSILVSCGSNDSDNSAGSSNTNTGERTFRRISEQVDFANGDKIVRVNEFAPNGTILRVTSTENGVLFGVAQFETRANGEVIRENVDEDADGVVDYSHEFDYQPVDGLSRIYRVLPSGEISWFQFFEFENGVALNRKMRVLENVFNKDGLDENSGSPGRTLVYRYENDLFTGFSIDFDTDGVIDGDMAFSYNINGTLNTVMHTTVADGALWTLTATYEEGPCLWPSNTAHDQQCVTVSE